MANTQSARGDEWVQEPSLVRPANQVRPLVTTKTTTAGLLDTGHGTSDLVDGVADEGHGHYTDDRPGSFFEELFAPESHGHFTRRGTPLVHLFLIEPAVLHRDLFLDYRIGNNVDGSTDEQELETELEWSLTKRLGVIIEAPYLGLDPVVAPNTSGFGDLAVAGRAVLVDADTFFLSANLEVEIPTGDERRGLGRGETAISPTVTTWLDLGNWTALHGQFGPEIGLQSGDTELLYGLALTHSFQGPILFGTHECSVHDDTEDHHEHFEPGFTSLILEMNGVTAFHVPLVAESPEQSVHRTASLAFELRTCRNLPQLAHHTMVFHQQFLVSPMIARAPRALNAELP